LEIFTGIVKTGSGGAVSEMSDARTLGDLEILTGLKVILGTLLCFDDNQGDIVC